jgi:hypothetical protein
MPVLLAAADGESSDGETLRRHAAEDCDAAGASGIGGLRTGAGFGQAVGREMCLRNRMEKRRFWGLHGRESLTRTRSRDPRPSLP